MHLFVMNSASLSVLAFLVVVNFCMYARYSGLSFGELIAKPMSYLFLMECVVFGTSFLGPCVLLGTISRGNLTRMFCWIDSEVKEWSDGQQKSDETLKVSAKFLAVVAIYRSNAASDCDSGLDGCS